MLCFILSVVKFQPVWLVLLDNLCRCSCYGYVLFDKGLVHCGVGSNGVVATYCDVAKENCSWTDIDIVANLWSLTVSTARSDIHANVNPTVSSYMGIVVDDYISVMR